MDLIINNFVFVSLMHTYIRWILLFEPVSCRGFLLMDHHIYIYSVAQQQEPNIIIFVSYEIHSGRQFQRNVLLLYENNKFVPEDIEAVSVR